jgi:membrane-associated protease RseP (regulator of RpoE activity)
MAYLVGVVLFALGILVSVCLHEAGHMFTARGFGMKVTRYFVGFGPTIFAFRRGEVEYGLKAIPAGAFVKIEGMTPLEEEEEVKPADRHRVFWRKPVWQRTIVLAAGSVTHFILAFLVLWITVSFVGAPNPAYTNWDPKKSAATIGALSPCVHVKYSTSASCGKKDPKSPAKKAGLKPGDRITSLDGVATPTYQKLVNTVRKHDPGKTPITYVRHGKTHTTTVTLVRGRTAVGGTVNKPKIKTVSMIGITAKLPPQTVTYGALRGVPETGVLYGQTLSGMAHAVAGLPGKIPNLISALAGNQRSADTPISVVGATRLGGQTAEYDAWWAFLMLLAQLNLFIGVFNLVPLLPLDGGHIAIAWYEKVRSWWAARRGKPDPGRVDYLKLMPITYAVVIVFGGLSLLTVAADIINPVTLN